MLEGRLLLANFTLSYSATVPVQTTDYTVPVSLPKFDPARGTLTEVDLSFATSGTAGGTLTNVANGPETFQFQEQINLALADPTTTLLAPDLLATQSYTALPPAGVAAFGPYAPVQNAAAIYTNGATFNEFGQGPGNVALTVQTVTSLTTTGGGGNIRSVLTTTAGGVATVTYQYTAAPVTLAGNVYEDVKGTGALAPGDNPIPGTLLTLFDSTGAVVATTTTAANGTYAFTTTTAGGPLPPDTYSIFETQPAGYLQGTNTVGTVNGATDGALTGLDRIGSILLTSGQNSINNNFGEILPVTIAGNVYQDVKGTGTLVPGDLPIPGTTLTLVNAAGAVVATTTTAADGTYSFTTNAAGAPLVPGAYKVTETQPAGYLQGSNTVGTVNGATDGVLVPVDMIGSIALTSGQSSVGNNFGEVLPVTIAGTVYQDVIGNGMLSPGDLPIPGTTLTLVNAAGAVVATTTTAADGTYSFTTNAAGAPLVPGAYKVTETQPAGYLQGSNTVGTVNGATVGVLVPVDMIGSIALASGQHSISNNFGEVLPVTLSGTVYYDRLGTGMLQPGDTAIPGVTVTLTNAGGVVATTITNAFGVYSFTTNGAGSPLAPGTYKITETQPAGYAQGSNTVGTVNGATNGVLVPVDMIGSIGLTSGQSSVGNNFGEILTTSFHLTNVQRFGVHLQPTLIVLTFDSPLNPASAQNVANYQIFGPTDSKHPAVVPIDSATYDAATQTVTLHLGERLDIHHPYRLTVSNLTNTTGGQLVGSNGQVGASYVTTLNRSDLAGFTDIYGNFIPINHGQLYPSAIASGYNLKRFAPPANLGPFASANRAAFVVATSPGGETPPIDLGHGLSGKVHHSAIRPKATNHHRRGT